MGQSQYSQDNFGVSAASETQREVSDAIGQVLGADAGERGEVLEQVAAEIAEKIQPAKE